jgi:putative flippase GtrA
VSLLKKLSTHSNPLFFIQFAKYFIFSGLAAFVNLGSRYYFSEHLAFNFYIAVLAAYILGMVVNFGCNKHFNFPKGSRDYIAEVVTFFVIALIGLALVTLFSWLFLIIFNQLLAEMLSQKWIESSSHFIAVGSVSVYSFLGHKFFTFNKGIRAGTKRILEKLGK